MGRTDNPDVDAMRHLSKRDREELMYPHCDYCGETLEDELYDIGGEILCENCMKKEYLKKAERYKYEA